VVCDPPVRELASPLVNSREKDEYDQKNRNYVAGGDFVAGWLCKAIIRRLGFESIIF
jgi:hypothetical protein